MLAALCVVGAGLTSVAAAVGGGSAGATTPTPTLQVSQSSVTAGNPVALQGTGCVGPAGVSAVLASVVSPVGNTVASSVLVPYDTAGDWYGSIPVPTTVLPGAAYSVTASCRAQGPVFTYTPVTITVTAATAYALTLSPDAAAPGGTTTVSGGNCFAPAGTTSPISAVATLSNDESIPVDVAAVVPLATGAWSATLTVPTNAQPGVFQVSATCDQYLSGQSYAPISLSVQPSPVSPAATVLKYRGPTSGPAGSAATLSASLKAGGVGVAGMPVVLSLGTSTVTAVTSAGGVARGLVTVPAAGPTTASASFAGTSGFAASSTGPVAFTAGAALAATTLNWSGSTSYREYSPSTLSAKLTATSGGAAVSGRAVTFDLPNGSAEAALTNGKGVASMTAAFTTLGATTVGLVFNGAGDSSYASSTAAVSLTVTAPFTPVSVSCPTATACTLVGNAGQTEYTTNGGQTWKWVTPVTTENLATVSCPSSTLCLAVGSTGHVLKSVNGGAKWKADGTIARQAFSVLKCRSATTCVVVGSAGAVYSTANGGTSWTAGTSGTLDNFDALSCPTSTACLATANNSSGGGTFASSNGGSTWSALPSTEPTGPNSGEDRLVCTTATTCVDAGFGTETYYTSDGGLLWTSTGGLYGGSVWCTSSTACLEVSYYGVASSTNGGQTWSLSYPFYAGEYSTDLTCTASQCLAVFESPSSDSVVYASTDGGVTWKGPVGL